jgi:hypothetical protein
MEYIGKEKGTEISVLFAYFPSFAKMKVGLCDLHAVCVSMNPLLLTFECLNQSL